MCNTIQTDSRSFQEKLKHVAQQCAEGADIHIAWHDFLYSILKEWNANIQMDLHDAVVIMLWATGLNRFTFRDYLRYLVLLGVMQNKNGINFWFKIPTEMQELPSEMRRKKRIFMMTIAVFETINYWCWYDSSFISFNRESLIDVLENGFIHIDWTSYQRPL